MSENRKSEDFAGLFLTFSFRSWCGTSCRMLHPSRLIIETHHRQDVFKPLDWHGRFARWLAEQPRAPRASQVFVTRFCQAEEEKVYGRPDHDHVDPTATPLCHCQALKIGVAEDELQHGHGEEQVKQLQCGRGSPQVSGALGLSKDIGRGCSCRWFGLGCPNGSVH